jgi:hypothetical protein
MKLTSPHLQGLYKTATLTGFQVVDTLDPLDVIKILNAQGINFVLVGAYGMVGWTKEARATEDVDLVVAARHHKKTISLLTAAFPQLQAKDHEVVTRLCDRDTGQVMIDLMKPIQPLYRAAFKFTQPVVAGKEGYRVPSLEMALAMKFAPMISLTRADKDKFQDAHDFILMVEANADINLEKLAELGEMVYSGGGQEIVERVRQVRAGERMKL